jgi:FAD/FMN-containing dehydrogenase
MPNLVRCRSVTDVVDAVVTAVRHAGTVTPRGGGHCFVDRVPPDGTVLDMSGVDGISVAPDGTATIGAGAVLAQVYTQLHHHGRTLPGGCGPTVGITGLTLGGGIGLLGRVHGLTCDRLTGAQVVLADGSVVTCDDEHEPDLFWALRGAGGGQFGVVTSLRFATVAEPVTTRIEAHPDVPAAELAAAWQSWDAPDEITVNLTLASGPDGAVHATLFGASTLDEPTTRDLLRALTDTAELRGGLPYHRLKDSFAGPREIPAHRLRSEFFTRPLTGGTLASLLAQLAEPRESGHRELTFTAMSGAYNRVAEDATAFAHRGQRFLLEHIATPDDPWLDRSWKTAHADGSGRVYPNFPDLALDDWATAYHAGNQERLRAVKAAYDPHRFFDFPQAI